MQSSEYAVNVLVPAAAVCPSFNYAAVVSEYLEMKTGGSRFDNCLDEHLESNALCPSHVSPILLPFPDETPGSPLVPNDDSNPDTGAHIRERSKVVDGLGA